MEFPDVIIWTILFPLNGRFVVFFIFIQILIEKADTNSGEPDQTPQNAASDLGLHCLHTSHKKDARLIWVKWSHFTIFRAHYIFAAPEDLFPTWETVRTPMRFHGRIQRGGGGGDRDSESP